MTHVRNSCFLRGTVLATLLGSSLVAQAGYISMPETASFDINGTIESFNLNAELNLDDGNPDTNLYEFLNEGYLVRDDPDYSSDYDMGFVAAITDINVAFKTILFGLGYDDRTNPPQTVGIIDRLALNTVYDFTFTSLNFLYDATIGCTGPSLDPACVEIGQESHSGSTKVTFYDSKAVNATPTLPLLLSAAGLLFLGRIKSKRQR
ncbi:hypothetical protein [Allohahella sp. A8]|uniref:hypothetical protein n=1 Tax=Allohahella sp. A8 TaxID=3141461 RepID=UPI003A8124DA